MKLYNKCKTNKTKRTRFDWFLSNSMTNNFSLSVWFLLLFFLRWQMNDIYRRKYVICYRFFTLLLIFFFFVMYNSFLSYFFIQNISKWLMTLIIDSTHTHTHLNTWINTHIHPLQNVPSSILNEKILNKAQGFYYWIELNS